MKALGIALMAAPFVTLLVLIYMAAGFWGAVIAVAIPFWVIGCLIGGAALIGRG